jgi:hypothetical protein
MENAMKETQNNYLSYREMQELLPDYAFGRISEEDKIKFETTLPLYPDLEQEIKDVRAVFSRVEKMDFNAKVSSHTRNLSVKVNDRLAKKSKRKSPVRRLAPVFGMLVAAIVILNIWGGKEENSQIAENQSEPLYFDNLIDKEAETIILSSIDEDELIHTSEINPTANTVNITEGMIVEEEELDDLFGEMIAELDGLENIDFSFNETGTYFDIDFIDEIGSLETSEINDLIEDLENVKIL